MSKIIREGRDLRDIKVAGQVDPTSVPDTEQRVRAQSDEPASAVYRKPRRRG